MAPGPQRARCGARARGTRSRNAPSSRGRSKARYYGADASRPAHGNSRSIIGENAATSAASAVSRRIQRSNRLGSSCPDFFFSSIMAFVSRIDLGEHAFCSAALSRASPAEFGEVVTAEWLVVNRWKPKIVDRRPSRRFARDFRPIRSTIQSAASCLSSVAWTSECSEPLRYQSLPRTSYCHDFARGQDRGRHCLRNLANRLGGRVPSARSMTYAAVGAPPEDDLSPR